MGELPIQCTDALSSWTHCKVHADFVGDTFTKSDIGSCKLCCAPETISKVSRMYSAFCLHQPSSRTHLKSVFLLNSLINWRGKAPATLSIVL